jgi:SAM-dependent methyltransferase
MKQLSRRYPFGDRMSFTDPNFVEIYEQIDGARTEDIEFYRNIAKKVSGPILEAGCGSGRVLLPLLLDGLDISGFDTSEPMLDVLRKRAAELDLTPKVWQGDFGSIEGKYAAIIAPFNTILHLMDAEAQIEAFRRVYHGLRAGGTFAFDIVNPYTLDIYDDRRHFESSFIDVQSDENFEIWRTFEHDPITQKAKYHREFLSSSKSVKSTIEFRWTYPSEIILLLKLAGFSTSEVFGDFDRSALSPESTSQIWVAKK